MLKSQILSGDSLIKNPVTPRVDQMIRKYSKGYSLDAGCGSGSYLSSFNGTVVGVDIRSKILQQAKKRKRIYLVLCSITHLPFKNQTFNFILFSEVIEHFVDCDAKQALREIERTSKGVILVDTPNTAFFLEFIRKILYGNWIYDARRITKVPMQHKSLWNKKKLLNEGFIVKGCLGWMTYRKLRWKKLAHVIDSVSWKNPSIAGTLIGIKGSHLDS